MTGTGTRRAAPLPLVALPIGTGLLAWALGTGWSGLAVLAHGCAGLGVAFVLVRAARVDHRWSARAGAVVVTVASAVGVLLAAGLLRSLGGRRALSVHVALGLAAAVPAAVAAIGWGRRGRPTTASRNPTVVLNPGRRRILGAAAVIVGAVTGRAVIEAATRAMSLPGTRRRFTGSYRVPATGPTAEFPVTQWLTDQPPPTALTPDWRLVVSAGDTTTFRYEQLVGFSDHVRAALDCTSGWYSINDWRGVRLDRLISERGTGRSLAIRSATGYSRWFPLSDLSRLLLATHVDGQTLDQGHGYPLRLVAPGRRASGGSSGCRLSS